MEFLSKNNSQRPKLVIGFAAETNNILKFAKDKKNNKYCDWIIANDISNPENPEYIDTYPTLNAWAVKLEAFPDHPNYEFVIYVADTEFVNVGAYMYYNDTHNFFLIDHLFDY